MMISIMIAALLGLGALAEPGTPLAPAGKWTIEYADNLCVLSREYPTDKSKVTFAVRPWPMGDSVELVLIQPGGYGIGIQNGKATVVLGSGSAPVTGTYNAYYAAKAKVRIATINIPHAAMGQLGDAATIDIAMAGKPPVSLTLSNVKNALGALTTCTNDLLSSWHVDPTEQLRIATPPQPMGGVADWIGSDDYPADALRRESQGAVTLVWTIDTQGKISNCSAAATSGDPALDTAACAVIAKRGRYKPALDKDGKPIAVHSTRRVVWRLPG